MLVVDERLPLFPRNGEVAGDAIRKCTVRPDFVDFYDQVELVGDGVIIVHLEGFGLGREFHRLLGSVESAQVAVENGHI